MKPREGQGMAEMLLAVWILRDEALDRRPDQCDLDPNASSRLSVGEDDV